MRSNWAAVGLIHDNDMDTEIHNVHSDGKASSLVCSTEPNTELTRKRKITEIPPK